MMDHSTTIRLICILIDDDLKICDSPFTIRVPSSEEVGGVIHYVKEATPSLRDVDHGKFRFYKPPLDHAIHVSSLHGSQLTREHLGSALPVTYKVEEEFREKDADRRFDVDVIVRVSSGVHGGVVLHTSLNTESSNNLLRHVTFCLRNCDEIQLFPEARLFDNNLSESPVDELLPEFVVQLEQELSLPRSPRRDTTTLSLLDAVKMLLGDKAFREHFTDPKDGSDSRMRCVMAVELLHYIDVFLDQHLSNQEAYRDNGLSHVYSLLRRFTTASSLQRDVKLQFDVPWPFRLLVETIQDDALYQYTPRSSFSMSVKDFPYLLLGVSSNESHEGEIHTVLLQASCLVRLGNALLKDKSSTFFVKAIHITHDYCAVEYTLYQNGSKTNNDNVNYRKMSYNLSDRREMFAFVFRTYNFLHSMKALHERLSSQLTSALTSILTETENLPHLTREHSSDDDSSSMWWSQVSRDSSRINLRNSRVRALIQRDGYTLLPEGSAQLKPTIGKAISSYRRVDTVALKLLDSATEELQILRHLQAIRSEFNRTIKLLDIVQLNIPPASIVRTVIVMPWQRPLTRCLREDYFPHVVKLLRIQFLEGVAFLHKCGVAHLDLKPENTLVDDRHDPLSPQLSIIDFRLSVFVESEETLVEGFRGTPSWAAPEAGTERGPATKYSAVLADRWSCGQMLKYFASFLPAGGASVWEFTYAGLLSLDPRQRPPLTTVLRGLRGTSARKRSNDGFDGIVAHKRHRVL